MRTPELIETETVLSSLGRSHRRVMETCSIECPPSSARRATAHAEALLVNRLAQALGQDYDAQLQTGSWPALRIF